jgi:hypothetical protein
MPQIDLKTSFTSIYNHLTSQGGKTTSIAHQIGFTTTTQLQNVLSGKSQLSVKAITGMIENLKVNPAYLFLGQGIMFLSDEDELQKLRLENEELHRKFHELADQAVKLGKYATQMDRKYGDLQDITATAIKYYKEKLKSLGISDEEEPKAATLE